MWQDSWEILAKENHSFLVNCVCFGVWHILLLFNILDFVPGDLQLQRAYWDSYLGTSLFELSKMLKKSENVNVLDFQKSSLMFRKVLEMFGRSWRRVFKLSEGFLENFEFLKMFGNDRQFWKKGGLFTGSITYGRFDKIIQLVFVKRGKCDSCVAVMVSLTRTCFRSKSFVFSNLLFLYYWLLDVRSYNRHFSTVRKYLDLKCIACF